MKTLRRVLGYSSLAISAISLAAGSVLYGCSTSKEVDVVPSPPPVVQMAPPVVESAPPVVVAAPAPVVQVPSPVVVPSTDTSQTTTTSWGNGVVEQNKTRTVDGTTQRQTTTTWNSGYPGSQTTTTTTTGQ